MEHTNLRFRPDEQGDSVAEPWRTLGTPEETIEPALEAGDAACWAHLLCPDCGAVLDGGPHAPGCRAGTA